MRRKNPISIKVKSPSRGLVTRLPSNEADGMNPATQTSLGDMNRVCAVAENVRFEDGVMCNAPGYELAALSGGATTRPANTNLLAHWKLDEATGTRFDSVGGFDLVDELNFGVPLLTGIAGKIGNAVNFINIGQKLDNLTNAVQGLRLDASDFTIAFWFKPADLVSSNGILLKATGGTIEYEVTVLNNTIAFVGGTSAAISTSGQFTAGVWSFAIVRFAVSTGTVSISINGNANADTVLAPLVTVGVPFSSQPISMQGNASAPVDSVSIWKRRLTDAEAGGLYNSGAGLDYPFFGGPYNLIFQGNIIGSPATPLFLGNPGQLFLGTPGFSSGPPRSYTLATTLLYGGGMPSAGFRWQACDFIDKEVFAQNGSTPQFWVGTSPGSTADVPGLPTGASQFNGVESFFGHLLFWTGNTVTWSDLNDFTNYVPVGLTSNVFPLVATVSGGFIQPAAGAASVAINLTDLSLNGAAPDIGDLDDKGFYRIGNNFYQLNAPAMATSVTFTSLDKTGRSATSTVFPSPTTFTPLAANEAGTAQIVGSDANGEIFQIKAMGDYAYIFKERSIQSVQYVGAGSGTFYIRTEVTNEGMIARYGLVALGVGQLIFLGQRELYSYAGGATPTPICQQFTRQLFAELDRNHLEQVVMLHRELRNEIWIIYPALGGVLKVLVWNYLENTAALDLYDPSILGITAARMADWVTDPAWLSLSDTNTWDDYSSMVTWAELAGGGKERVALISTGDGNLAIHGNVYNRNGAAYTSTAETMDYDFDDNAVFKYVDVVNFGLQVKVPDSTIRNITVQVGYRSTLDSDITWTAPKLVQVQGNANFTAKANPGGSGRYVRLRVQSSDADVQWRVSSYEIYARAGGTY